jgi:hypothetical protein
MMLGLWAKRKKKEQRRYRTATQKSNRANSFVHHPLRRKLPAAALSYGKPSQDKDAYNSTVCAKKEYFINQLQAVRTAKESKPQGKNLLQQQAGNLCLHSET